MSQERERLWERLPEAIRAANVDPVDAEAPGLYERFLGVGDALYDRVSEKLTRLLSFRDPRTIPAPFLELLGELVGHEWRADQSVEWNRRRICDSIPRYQSKGPDGWLGHLIREHGGGPWTKTDVASKLLILSRQGKLSHSDGHLCDSGFWQSGSYLLQLSDDVDLEGLRRDLADHIPSGQVWYFQILEHEFVVLEVVFSEHETALEREGNTREGSLGYGRLSESFFLSFAPNGVETDTSRPILYDQDGNTREGSLGYGKLSESFFLSFQPNGVETETSRPILYDRDSNTMEGALGTRKLSSDFYLSVEPNGVERDTGMESDHAVAGGSFTMDSNLTMDRTDITLDMGTPENPLPEDLALIQDDGHLVLTDHDSGIAGGSLTMDSNITMDRTDITMDMGTPENPLSEDLALIQDDGKDE